MPTGERQQPATPPRADERGALLAGMATLVAILSIFSLIGFQEYVELLRRDNEAEMMFRAQELVRGIQRYRLDRGGTAPLKLEDLIEPGTKGQYYVRRLYEDPLTKDGKWGLLFVGPGNQIIDPNAEEADPATLAALGGGLGRGSFGRGQVAGREGRSGPDARGRNGGGRDDEKPKGLSRLDELSRSGNGRSAGRLGGVGNPGGAGGETGLPIAGVRTLAEDQPFRVYNGLTEYSEWLFTYFDLENAQIPGQGGQQGQKPGQPPGGIGQPGQGTQPGDDPGKPGSPFGGRSIGDRGNDRRDRDDRGRDDRDDRNERPWDRNDRDDRDDRDERPYEDEDDADERPYDDADDERPYDDPDDAQDDPQDDDPQDDDPQDDKDDTDEDEDEDDDDR